MMSATVDHPRGRGRPKKATPSRPNASNTADDWANVSDTTDKFNKVFRTSAHVLGSHAMFETVPYVEINEEMPVSYIYESILEQFLGYSLLDPKDDPIPFCRPDGSILHPISRDFLTISVGSKFLNPVLIEWVVLPGEPVEGDPWVVVGKPDIAKCLGPDWTPEKAREQYRAEMMEREKPSERLPSATLLQFYERLPPATLLHLLCQRPYPVVSQSQLPPANDRSNDQVQNSANPVAEIKERHLDDVLQARPGEHSKVIQELPLLAPEGVSTSSSPAVQARPLGSGERPRAVGSWVRLRNALSDFLRPAPPKGFCRMSWTCRCGKRLHMEVAESCVVAGIAFAQNASGTSPASDISVRRSSASSLTSSTSVVSSTSGTSVNTPSTAPSSAPSVDSHNQVLPSPFIPSGTKKYMLLCVNIGLRLIGLANVDVTDVDKDEEVFNRLREAYHGLRGRLGHNPLMKPASMHYVKFQLFHLQRSRECVGNYQVNSIPSEKEVFRQEYSFRPCPPAHGELPIPPNLFMHVFLNPGDHFGSMAVEMLPKKLREKLIWDSSSHDLSNLPMGWGFYIVEEVDKGLVALVIIAAVLLMIVLTVAWCVINGDVQGGTGIGQFSVAVLALVISAVLLRSGLSPTAG